MVNKVLFKTMDVTFFTNLEKLKNPFQILLLKRNSWFWKYNIYGIYIIKIKFKNFYGQPY